MELHSNNIFRLLEIYLKLNRNNTMKKIRYREKKTVDVCHISGKFQNQSIFDLHTHLVMGRALGRVSFLNNRF